MNSTIKNWQKITKDMLGFEALDFLCTKKIQALCAALPSPVLVVHGKTAKNSGILPRLEDGFKRKNKAFIFLEVATEPRLSLFLQNHDSRSVLGIGGGSVLESAKLLSLEFNHPKDLLYLGQKGYKKPRRNKKLVLMATNWSSSVWISKTSVVIEDNYKFPVISDSLVPDQVFYDSAIFPKKGTELFSLSCIDCLCHWLEIFLWANVEDSFVIRSLIGWFEEFEKACFQENRDALFFLASWLYSGLYPLESIPWPIHTLSHALSPALGISHALSLLPLMRMRIGKETSPQKQEILQKAAFFLDSFSILCREYRHEEVFNAKQTALKWNPCMQEADFFWV